MNDLSQFAVTQRWPPQDATRIQLYSFPTPNGLKVSIALKEMNIPFEAHRVALSDADVRSPQFLSLSPNNKIPAIIDPNGPDGSPLALWESGAILLYLAEKSGRLAGTSATEKAHITQWIMWQMGGLGPMLGQLGYFTKFAGSDVEDPRPQAHFANEGRRLLTVLSKALGNHDWIVGDFSIADIAIVPWLNALTFYGTRDLVGWPEFPNLQSYCDRFMARAGVQAGLDVPPRDV